MTTYHLRVEVPGLDRFVAQGTYQLPEDGSVDPDKISLVDEDGEELDTQAAVVDRWHNGNPRYIHLAGNARKKGRNVGSTVAFHIKENSDHVLDPEHPKVLNEAWDWATSKGAIRLRATDDFGNTYEADLTRTFKDYNDGARTARVHRHGPAMVSVEFPTWLQPATVVNQNEVVPFMGGVIAFMHARAHSRVLGFDIIWHNGMATDGLTNFHLRYRSLELIVPAGAVMVPNMPYPSLGSPYELSELEVAYPLVAPSDDGSAHDLPTQMETTFRVQVAPEEYEFRAREYARGAGWGTCYSVLRNAERCGWQMHRYPMPDLGHMASQVISRVDRYHREYDEAMRTGTAPNDSGGDGRVGPWAVKGVPYGGQTGGRDDKHPFAGCLEMWHGGTKALQLLWMRHHMTMNRHHNCVYDASGMPVKIDEHLNSDGSQPWQQNMIQGFGFRSGDDRPFDFSSPDFAQGAERLAPYRRRLHYGYKDSPSGDRDYTGYMMYDGQHFSRWTSCAFPLVYGAGDLMAMRQVLMQAEIGRMRFYEGPRGRLRGAADSGNGTGNDVMGRESGQVINCMVAGWGLADDERRGLWSDQWRTWVDCAERVVTPNGQLGGLSSGKVAGVFDDQFRALRPNGQMFLHIGFWSLINGPLLGDPALRGRMLEVMSKTAHGFWEHSWAKHPNGERRSGTWTHVATGPLRPDNADDMFAPGTHPPEQYEIGIDRYLMPHLIAFYKAMGIEPAQDMLNQFFGVSSAEEARDEIERDGLESYEHRLPLLGVLQSQL